MRIKRLLVISSVTVVVVLFAAVGLYFYLRYFGMRQTGGPGTKIVSKIQIKTVPVNVFQMQGDLSRASRPLASLLPDDWQRMKKKIVIEKSERILTVYVDDQPIKSYFAALGPVELGPKTQRNDCKTPEGSYYVCSKNPRSRYELSLLLSYPSIKDAENGVKNNLIDEKILEQVKWAIKHKKTPPQDTSLGSAICIHGGGIGEVSSDLKMARIVDWTQGCIALRKEDMVEVYNFAEPGTTVSIQP